MSFLFGSTPKVTAPQVNFTPPSLSSPGLSATFSGNAYNVSESPQTQADVSGLQSTFQQAGNAFGNIAQQWAPGSSNLRAALLQQLQNQRAQGLGDLRQQLAQRRILGSSFGQASLTNADLAYQQGIQQIEAQTFLQELQATSDLTQKQFSSYASGYQSGLTQMNFESGLAAQLTGQATSALASAAQTNAQLQLQASMANANYQAQSQAGMGRLIGTIAGIAAAPFTGGASLALSAGSLGGSGGGLGGLY